MSIPRLLETMKRGGHLSVPVILGWLCSISVASAPTDLRVGAMTHFAQGWSTDLVPRLNDAGITTVRDELYWSKVEIKPGQFIFPTGYIRYMSALEAANIDPMIVLSFANPNYDGGQTPYTEAGIAAYAQYSMEVLRHFGPQIKAVEVWNEYNGSFCTGPAMSDRATVYTKMLKATYRSIKRERPDVTVAGAATIGTPEPYFERLFSHGALASMDVVSVHPYRYDSPPEGMEREITNLRKLMRSYNHGIAKPIWVTELGWYTKPSKVQGDLEVNDETQAKFAIRAYVLLFSVGVERVYWYEFRDYNQDPPMGMVRDDATYSAKPLFTAIKTLTKTLVGASFVGRESTLPSIYSMVFRRNTADEVRVLWSTEPIKLTLTGAKSCRNIKGESVTVGVSFTLTDSPLFVEGPVRGLPLTPALASLPLADSVAAFSNQQGFHQWFYGYFVGDSNEFNLAQEFRTTDWVKEWWVPGFSYYSQTVDDMHPSVFKHVAITAVRRWVSDWDGPATLQAHFAIGLQGDGVRVRILQGGKDIYSVRLGGGQPISVTIQQAISLTRQQPIDIAIDPGPNGNMNYDGTDVGVEILPKQTVPESSR